MEERLTFDIEADELELFLEEVNEHLQAMEAGILGLEQGADPDVLNVTFRAAHTLKALAGTIKHQRMAELTHTMETLFDMMRDGRLATSSSVVDDLLATMDTLKALRDEIVTLRPSGADVAAVLKRLQVVISSGPQQAAVTAVRGKRKGGGDDLTPEQRAEASRLQTEGFRLYEVVVSSKPDAFAPAARLSQAALALMEVGQVITQRPTLSDLAKGQHNNRLWLILAAQCAETAINQLLAEVSDLAGYAVEAYSLEAATAPEAPPAAPPSATAVGAPPAAGDLGVDKTVRISVERLDNLMNLVGELVTNHTRLLQIENSLRAQYGRDGTVSDLADMSAHVGRVIDQLQEEVMRARMLPISHLFGKLPRLVRDVARAAGKQVDLIIEGEATELDRSLIEVIGDPLIHLLRNAVDHGIETPERRLAAGKPATGKVRLTAAHVEGQILITVEDDGQGIDPNKVRAAAVKRGLITEEEAAQLSDADAIDLIFRPNLSTAEQVTSVSGRGVGMDVVRSNVERLSGSVVVDSQVGVGTTFRVTLPLTLAIVQTMLVAVGDTVYAVPLAGIIDSLYLVDSMIQTVKGSPTVRWRDSVLPLLDLRQFFHHPRMARQLDGNSKPAIVTVSWGKLYAGLVVDRIIGNQEVVVKSLSPIVGKVPGLLGGAILGDGRIALIVDVPGLISAALQARRQGVVA